MTMLSLQSVVILQRNLDRRQSHSNLDISTYMTVLLFRVILIPRKGLRPKTKPLREDIGPIDGKQVNVGQIDDLQKEQFCVSQNQSDRNTGKKCILRMKIDLSKSLVLKNPLENLFAPWGCFE